MKNLLNSPEAAVDDLITGLVSRNASLARVANWPVVVRSGASSSTVKVISGGGSGHEPAHAGYVGDGMLDAAVCGPVFTSPSVDAILAALRAVAPGDEDIIMVVKNYTGDRLNFGLAARQARAEGHRVRTVLVADDVALGEDVGAGRRGLAGTVLVHKVIGAKVRDGATMDQAADAAEELLSGLGTMGVSLGPCNVPGASESSFDLGDADVEWGLGIHGEPGVEQTPGQSARDTAQRLVKTIVADRGLRDEDVLVMVNGLGGLSSLELEVLSGEVLSEVRARGLRPVMGWTGNFLTSLDMPGVSLTVARVSPDMRELLEAPTAAPAWGVPSVIPREPALVHVETPDLFASEAQAGEAGRFPREIHEAVLRAAEVLIDREEELTRADRAVGDGDLGVNLSRGAKAVIDSSEKFETLNGPAAYFTALSALLRNHVGGTSGPLYAVLALGLARGYSDVSAREPGAQLAALKRGFRIAVDDMCHLGGAEEGDSTMMDALIPAARVLNDEKHENSGAAELFRDAMSAAEKGTASTAEYAASKGRSSYVGERSIGTPDPGATAVLLWARAAFGPIVEG